MRIDLHVHTTASDGTLTPAEVVALAAQKGVRAIAITDHDSVEGVAEALAAANVLPHAPIVVPGVELSAVHQDRDVHILGYFVDHTDEGFLDYLRDLREARMRRAEAIVSALAAAGYTIDMRHVLALSAGAAVGRSHVARVLVEQGLADDVADAFRRLLGRGKPFYVPKDVRSPEDAVRLVRAVGGVPVLAHPGVTGGDEIVPALVAHGLAGIEAYDGEHDEADRERYASIADRLGLIVTGGTDFHDPGAPTGDLASTDIPPGILESLFAAANRPLPARETP